MEARVKKHGLVGEGSGRGLFCRQARKTGPRRTIGTPIISLLYSVNKPDKTKTLDSIFQMVEQL